MVVLGVGGIGPHEVGPVDHLPHNVQVRGLLQVEHLASDEHGHLGESAQRQRPQNRVRLDTDVVIHEQDLFASGVAHRLQHHPAVAARTAQVGLVVNGQPIAQCGGRLGEIRVPHSLVGALVDDDDGTDHLVHQRIGSQCPQRVDAIRRPVKCRDSDGDIGPPGRRHGGEPRRTVHGGLRVGGDVEPDPATVLERLEADLEFQGSGAGPITDDLRAAHADPCAGGLRAVNVHPGHPGQFDAQHYRCQSRPAPPVTGREGVEIGGERHLGLRADLQSRPSCRVRPLGVGLGFLDVELADVQRLAGPGQDYPGEQTHRAGLVRSDGAGGYFTHALLLSSAAAVSGSPSRRCGARTLSYMFSALAMAMCMSRY